MTLFFYFLLLFVTLCRFPFNLEFLFYLLVFWWFPFLSSGLIITCIFLSLLNFGGGEVPAGLGEWDLVAVRGRWQGSKLKKYELRSVGLFTRSPAGLATTQMLAGEGLRAEWGRRGCTGSYKRAGEGGKGVWKGRLAEGNCSRWGDWAWLAPERGWRQTEAGGKGGGWLRCLPTDGGVAMGLWGHLDVGALGR